MIIGIISAMDDEMLILREEFKAIKSIRSCGIDFYSSTYERSEFVFAVAGVGKVNAAIAATIMIECFNCSLIINTGIAGGLKGVETADFVIGTKLTYNDVDVQALGYDFGQIPGLPKHYSTRLDLIVLIKSILNELKYPYKEGVVYSGDSFITSLNQIKNYPCDIAISEMEGTAIAQVCTRAGADFLVLRYISDVVGIPSQIANYKLFEAEVARKSSQICLEILKSLNNIL